MDPNVGCVDVVLNAGVLLPKIPLAVVVVVPLLPNKPLDVVVGAIVDPKMLEESSWLAVVAVIPVTFGLFPNEKAGAVVFVAVAPNIFDEVVVGVRPGPKPIEPPAPNVGVADVVTAGNDDAGFAPKLNDGALIGVVVAAIVDTFDAPNEGGGLAVAF